MSDPKAEPEWIGLLEASRRLGISRYTMVVLIRAGKLTTRQLAASPTRVLASEIDALAVKSTRKGIPLQDLPPYLRKRLAATERRQTRKVTDPAGAKLQEA